MDDKKNVIDYEVLGVGGLFNPFANHISSQRSGMHVQHKYGSQSPIIGEFPDCYSGFETYEADYLYESFVPDDDIEIVKIIHKFGRLSTDLSPSAVIIFRKLSTGELDYFWAKRYVNTTQNFGFMNQFDKILSLREGFVIRKDTEVLCPTNKDSESGEYRTGWNANIAFMSTLSTFEDAFPISQSFADRIASLYIETVTIDIDRDHIALNLYGDDYSYKIIPEIGEFTREDGVLAAVRKSTPLNMLFDLNKEESRNVNPMHDKIYYGRPNAQIVDVEVFSNDPLFGQLEEYYTHHIRFYKDLYDFYKEHQKEKISFKLNTLMAEAYKYTSREGVYTGRKRNITLFDKSTAISTKVNVTFVYSQPVEAGFKLTGRDGGKGVVHIVVPDEMMPIDEYGQRVDLIQDSASVIKRTNISQLYEQFYNRTSQLIIQRSKEMDVDSRFAYILEYVRDVAMDYADMIIASYPNKKEFLDEVDTHGLKLFIPPTAKWITLEHVLNIARKYTSEASHIFIPLGRNESGEMMYEKSKYLVMVGRKFMYLLYNMPNPLALSIGPTSQLEVPVKSIKDERFNLTARATRVLGEDERRILINAIDPAELERMCHLQAFSKRGTEALAATIVNSDNPVDIKVPMSDLELKRASTIKRVYTNLLQLVGIDISCARIESHYTNEVQK